MGSKTNRLSPNLEMALAELEEQVDLGVKFVPMQPSLAMMQAGARAGGIDEALAAKIYRAMLEADAIEDSETGPPARRRSSPTLPSERRGRGGSANSVVSLHP